MLYLSTLYVYEQELESGLEIIVLDPENNLIRMILHIYSKVTICNSSIVIYTVHDECNESSQTIQELGNDCRVTIDAGSKE